MSTCSLPGTELIYLGDRVREDNIEHTKKVETKNTPRIID